MCALAMPVRIRSVPARSASPDAAPARVVASIPRTIPAIAPAASAAAAASRRTSSATTLKPRPCSPARAASIAAFSASRFVRSAIWLIEPAIRPTSATRSVNSDTVAIEAVADSTANSRSAITPSTNTCPLCACERASPANAAACAASSARLLGSLVQRRRRNPHLVQLTSLRISDGTHLVGDDPKLRRGAAHPRNGLGERRRVAGGHNDNRSTPRPPAPAMSFGSTAARPRREI